MFQNPLWRQAGRELMALADRFERSSEREEVRRRAETVNVAAIDYDKFMMLLGALFPVNKSNHAANS